MCTSPGWIRLPKCYSLFGICFCFANMQCGHFLFSVIVIVLFGICFCFANMQCDHFYCQFTTSSFKRLDVNITKTRLFKYTETFHTKNENFQIKNSDIFHISAQNMDFLSTLSTHLTELFVKGNTWFI